MGHLYVRSEYFLSFKNSNCNRKSQDYATSMEIRFSHNHLRITFLTQCMITGGSCYWANTVNTLRPRQNGRHFPDDIFKCIFLNENVWISIKISLKVAPKGPIEIIPALVQIMAWRLPGDKSLSEPLMVILSTHIYVTRPQWTQMHT